MTAVAPESRTLPVDADPVAEAAEESPVADDMVLAGLLVEEISIDGMCGVY